MGSIDPALDYYEIFEGLLVKDQNRLAIHFKLANDILRSESMHPSFISINEFYEVFQGLIDKVLAWEASSKGLTFTADYPKEGLEQSEWNEVITYNTVNRAPASTKPKTPYQATNRRSLTPRMVREGLPDLNNPGHVIDVYEMAFENNIEMTCWALTNKEANTRVEWLEDLITEFRWYLQAYGIRQIFVVMQDADVTKKESPGSKIVHGRPLIVQIHTVKKYTQMLKTLEEVKLALKIHTQYDTTYEE